MTESFLLVRAGGRAFGLPVRGLEAVADAGSIAPVPAREASMVGVATFRGEMLPVLSLARLLAPAGAETRTVAMPMAVVLNASGRRLCLEVDHADLVVEGEPMTVPADRAVPWSRSVLRHDDTLVPLLDLSLLGARLAEEGSL